VSGVGALIHGELGECKRCRDTAQTGKHNNGVFKTLLGVTPGAFCTGSSIDRRVSAS
jgi:hypothetical protein